MKIITLFLICISFSTLLNAQESTDQQLAQYYYSNGDFEKATGYYQKVFEAEKSVFNFNRYYDCLIQIKDFKAVEKIIKQQLHSSNNAYNYQILLAELYETTDETKKAEKIYDNIIEDIEDNPNLVITVYNAFKDKSKYDHAFEALKKGRKELKNNYPLFAQFAELYAIQGKYDLMFDEYLEYLEHQPYMLEQIELQISKLIDFTEVDSPNFTLLKTRLLERIQKDPDETHYAEMLIWLFVQNKNFKGALRQAIALEKRLEGEGRRVFELGQICVENKDYGTGQKAFKFVVDQGSQKMYFFAAENAYLNTLFLEITTVRNFSATEIETTITAYQNVINRLGQNRRAFPVILELAEIQAFYGNKSEAAIELLEKTLNMEGITSMQQAKAKMKLADIMVLDGDIWQASLYYMQIDKDFKFEPIGHEAKFKNARIFFYDGEFDFAQSQLNVLKQSTSKLIANNAMQLSLLITDNFGIDSNYRAMTWFATGDLLVEQHRYAEAFTLFDSIIAVYPYHSLGDEILMRKAKAMQQQGDWLKAVDYLNELLKYHKEDILADDALFQLGNIYENKLNDTEKAAAYYKDILFNYKGSLYVIEARKRFRALRGDKVESD